MKKPLLPEENSYEPMLETGMNRFNKSSKTSKSVGRQVGTTKMRNTLNNRVLTT